MGGKVSEQQWHDVLGVIAVQGDELDLGYLGEWAEYLGVRNLLEKALAESREPHQPLALLPLLAPGHLDRFSLSAGAAPARSYFLRSQYKMRDPPGLRSDRTM